MLDTIQAMSLLTIMEVLGPVLLGGALIYGILMSRRRSQSAKAETDAATHNLYRQGARQERKDEAL